MFRLTLFHNHPGKVYPVLDKLNRRTGPLACHFLEWTGWYNQAVAQRLLGHYRLFQLYKKDRETALRTMPLTQAYILHYRSTHKIKYLISQVVSWLYRIGTFGHHYLAVEIETFNRSLIYEQAHILEQFLINADNDFNTAFHIAMDHHVHYHHQPFVTQEPIPNVPPDAPSHTGKAKGVFSKKQILIFFDLLARTAHLEKLDLSKPNKYQALAELFHALTGKTVSSWLQELNDHRHKDLYEFRTEGERKQLIVTITNLAELFRKAGFRIIAALADKKMRELEQYRKEE